MLTEFLPTIFSAFDNVDSAGMLTFSRSDRFLDQRRIKGRASVGTECLELFFADQQLALIKVGLVKSFARTVVVRSEKHGDAWHTTVNFAKMMLLPCNNPAQELSELRKFFELAKTFMEADPSKISTIQICNERDRNRKVYASVNCSRCEAGARGRSTTDRVFTAQFEALISSSPLLQEYLRQVALTLGRLGPWSWATIRESALYETTKGPWAQWCIAKERAAG